MKLFIVFLLILPISTLAGRFDDEQRKVVQIGGYSQNANYDQNHCIIYFDTNLPSQCVSKHRGIIYLDSPVGNVMCSVGLAALASNKFVSVSSFDDCDPIHRAPILRWVGVKSE